MKRVTKSAGSWSGYCMADGAELAKLKVWGSADGEYVFAESHVRYNDETKISFRRSESNVSCACLKRDWLAPRELRILLPTQKGF